MNDSFSNTVPPHFGTGWISGTLAVVLAAMGLLAVFCFHVPEYLTVPEAWGTYPLPVMRRLLHVILVAGYLLGFTSVMLRQNKTLLIVTAAPKPSAFVTAALGLLWLGFFCVAEPQAGITP